VIFPENRFALFRIMRQGFPSCGVSTIGGRGGLGRPRIAPGAGLTSTGGGKGAACWLEASGGTVAGAAAPGAPDNGVAAAPG